MIDEIALNSICNTPFVPSLYGKKQCTFLAGLAVYICSIQYCTIIVHDKDCKKAHAFSTIIAKTLRDCHGAFLQDSQRVLPDMFFCGLIGVYINIA